LPPSKPHGTDEEKGLPSSQRTSLESTTEYTDYTDTASETTSTLSTEIEPRPQKRTLEERLDLFWNQFDTFIDLFVPFSATIAAIICVLTYKHPGPNVWLFAYVWTAIVILLPRLFELVFTSREEFDKARTAGGRPHFPPSRSARSVGWAAAFIMGTAFDVFYARWAALQGRTLYPADKPFWVGPQGQWVSDTPTMQ
jgi:hypothetical protein